MVPDPPKATVMTDFAGLCCTTCMPLGSGGGGFYDAVGPSYAHTHTHIYIYIYIINIMNI